MKKIFINELETEKRNELIKKNEKLLNILYNDFIQIQYDQRKEASYNMMGMNWRWYVEYHDNYNSFFLTLTDWNNFYQNIDFIYLSDEASKNADKIKENIDKMDMLEYYDEEYYKLDDECEQLAKEILKEIENILHTYEEYPTEDEAIQYADEMEQLEEYYIEVREDGTSDNVIRKDIVYTECYI